MELQGNAEFLMETKVTVPHKCGLKWFLVTLNSDKSRKIWMLVQPYSGGGLIQTLAIIRGLAVILSLASPNAKSGPYPKPGLDINLAIILIVALIVT